MAKRAGRFKRNRGLLLDLTLVMQTFSGESNRSDLAGLSRRPAPPCRSREGEVELRSRAAGARGGRGWCRRTGHQGGAHQIAGPAEQRSRREVGPQAGQSNRAIDQEHPQLASRLGEIAIMTMMAAKAAPSST
jgi:hypothetical protein